MNRGINVIVDREPHPPESDPGASAGRAPDPDPGSGSFPTDPQAPEGVGPFVAGSAADDAATTPFPADREAWGAAPDAPREPPTQPTRVLAPTAVTPPPGPPPTPPGGANRYPSPQRGPGLGAIAAIALVAAVIGAGIVVGVLALAGDLHGAGQTTTVEASAPSSGAAPAAATSGGGGVSAATLFARSSPGVVDITAVTAAQPQTQTFPFGPGGGGGGSSGQTDLGSGFLVDNSGTILTAAHVVDGATSITVTFQTGTMRPAKILGEDRAWDVAVIKVNASGVPVHPLPLGSSRALRVGDYLAAIGDPFGYDRSLSTGVVAGLDRTISAPNGFSIAYAIQTDAALNPGNSGGPMLDASGDVVGIADQIATGGVETASGTATSSGVGFAVPIDLAKIDLPRLERGQAAQHAYLGVSTTDAPDDAGVLLQSVQAGTPAATAGLQTGDVLNSFNGTPLHASADLIDAIATEVPGNKVKIGVKRNGKQLTIVVTLGTQPSQAPTNG